MAWEGGVMQGSQEMNVVIALALLFLTGFVELDLRNWDLASAKSQPRGFTKLASVLSSGAEPVHVV